MNTHLENHSEHFSQLYSGQGGSEKIPIVYADTVGCALYSKKQVEDHKGLLLSQVIPSPHNESDTSAKINNVRKIVLSYFHTTEKEYSVIFTSGTTSSLKIVAECFDWSCDSKSSSIPTFLYLDESHRSLQGMREIVKNVNENVDIRCIKRGDVSDNLRECNERGGRYVLAYPAMSNFCGTVFPNEWIDQVNKDSNSQGFVVLDASAYLSSHRLDLSTLSPHFVCMSFYKMFGYPTGVGALLIRNDCDSLLHKKYFGGGTVEMSLVQTEGHVFKRENIHAKFEDGTSSFLEILALPSGFEFIEKMGGVEFISKFTSSLAVKLRDALVDMKHMSTGESVANVYACNGPIVTFNLFKSDGVSYHGYKTFSRICQRNGIIIRVGCMCNPGACSRYLHISDADIVKYHTRHGHKCDDDIDILDGKPLGAIRVSFGYHSTPDDVDRIMNVIVDNFVEKEVEPTDQVIKQGKLGCIRIYPIKSCGPMLVEKWPLSITGFKFDRSWAIVKNNTSSREDQHPSYKVMTQSQLPILSQIFPRVDLARNVLTLSVNKGLNLEIDDMKVPIEDDMASMELKSGCIGKVCGEPIHGVLVGASRGRRNTIDEHDVSDWLEQVTMEQNLHLFRITKRTDKTENSRLQKRTTKTLSAANTGQILIANRSSAECLHKMIRSNGNELDVEWILNQFRPNLVVNDWPEAGYEYHFPKMNILIESIKSNSGNGSSYDRMIRLDKLEDCIRCDMVKIDQSCGYENDSAYQALQSLTVKGPDKSFRFGILCTILNDVAHESSLSDNDFVVSKDDLIIPVLSS